jgi:hypothetical protein
LYVPPENNEPMIHNSGLESSSHIINTRNVTRDQLDAYIEVAALVPSPLCLVDRKGFVHYVNDELKALVGIELTTDFPYIGIIP